MELRAPQSMEEPRKGLTNSNRDAKAGVDSRSAAAGGGTGKVSPKLPKRKGQMSYGSACYSGRQGFKGEGGAERLGSSHNTRQVPPHSHASLSCPLGYHTCEAHGALESTTHALEAVLDEVAEELGWGVEHLVAQLTLVVNAFLCKEK